MKHFHLLTIGIVLGLSVLSCRKEDAFTATKWNPNEPTVVSGFYPRSAGIATPMIMDGRNFGSDTTGLRVFFCDSLGNKYRAGLVSSNGTKIYMFVPEGLTYKHTIKLQVARIVPKQGTRADASNDTLVLCDVKQPFIYKTQTAVSTVVGRASPEAQLPTVGGSLATATLSAPLFICCDNEDNICIVERKIEKDGYYIYSKAEATNKGSSGNILMAYLKNNNVTVLKYQAIEINAPTFSDEKNNEVIYVPEDNGLGYYQMAAALSYYPRRQRVLAGGNQTALDPGKNWKHSFVVNKLDRQIYTVMWGGQLVRINPTTRVGDILLDQIGEHEVGRGGCDAYCIFSPLPGEENLLYICRSDANEIWRVDVGQIKIEDKATYKGEPYAGKSIDVGINPGRGWEDGKLRNAMFNYPHQITFTYDGKLYIADTGNNCIRMIDTTLGDKATVTTVIGIPGSRGYKDGGPEIALFNRPCGVAVSNDGKIVYVADTFNRVIRKLSVQ